MEMRKKKNAKKRDSEKEKKTKSEMAREKPGVVLPFLKNAGCT